MNYHDFEKDEADLRSVDDPERLRRRTHSIRAQLAACDRDLESLAEERVEGLHGEAFTAEHADDLAEELEQKVRADINAGVQKHTPTNRGQRMLARLAPFADFLVFLYFLAVVLNVDWNQPSATPVVAVLALVLAVIATAGVAWTLRSIASRYRQNKPDDGRFNWRQRTRRGGLHADLLLLVLILGAVGAMMFYRIFTDARASALAVAPSLLVALFFALIAVALNYVILLVEFSDGSPTTDELRHLREQLEPIEARISATRKRKRELQHRLDTLTQLSDPTPTPAPGTGTGTGNRSGCAPLWVSEGPPASAPATLTQPKNSMSFVGEVDHLTDGSGGQRPVLEADQPNGSPDNHARAVLVTTSDPLRQTNTHTREGTSK